MDLSRRAARIAGALAVLALVAGPVGATSAPARAGADAPWVDLRTTIAGTAVHGSGGRRPVRISPALPVEVRVRVANRSATSVRVTAVRIQGAVMGLRLFAYDAVVDITAGPGATEERVLPVDFSGVRGEAVGLVPLRVEALDGARHVVAAESGVADVRGAATSVVGLFAMVLAVLTAAAVGSCVFAFRRGRLPASRPSRAARTLTAGVAFGMTIVVAGAASRAIVPIATRWAPIVLGWGVIGFLMGWFAPEPERPIDVREAAARPSEDDDVVVDLVERDPAEEATTEPA